MEPADSPAALGGPRGLLERWHLERQSGRSSVLALVTSTWGSTYSKPGAMALLSESGLVHGALSGGCLEPELERRAGLALASGRAARAEVDTQADADRVFGSGLGCRGRLDVLLLPIPLGSPSNLLVALARGFGLGETTRIVLSLADTSLGAGEATVGSQRLAWGADGNEAEAARPASLGPDSICLSIPPPRAILLLGGGPETPDLLAFARRLGWRTLVVDHRGRWSDQARRAGADEVHALRPEDAHAALSSRRLDAALAMSHSYELDLAHLRCWLPSSVPFLGLLGPARRRDELLRELGVSFEDVRARLHAPIGLPIGGHGPEAIALAIAAQLQERFASPERAAG